VTGNRDVAVGSATLVKGWKAAKSLPGIHWDYLDDCCTSRAAEVSEIIKQNGGFGMKVWAFAPLFFCPANEKPLGVPRLGVPDGWPVTWHYHVAVAILARTTNSNAAFAVIYPVLSSRPANLRSWTKAFNYD
jgi:hypothetical protein